MMITSELKPPLGHNCSIHLSPKGGKGSFMQTQREAFSSQENTTRKNNSFFYIEQIDHLFSLHDLMFANLLLLYTCILLSFVSATLHLYT